MTRDTSTADIKQFQIISSKYSRDFRREGIPVQLNYFESIFDNTVRFEIFCADSSKLIFDGGEKVYLKLEDSYGNVLNFADDNNQMRIHGIVNSDQFVQTAASTFHMYSKECIDDRDVEKRVVKNYTGKISDTVFAILKEFLKTPKQLDIEETLNNFNYTGRINDFGKPFYAINDLSSKSIPLSQNSKGNVAGFLFYETAGPNGCTYHFRSIENLKKQNYKKRYILSDTSYIPTGYDEKILSARSTKNIDLDDKLDKADMFQSTLRTYDPRTQTVVETAFNSEKQDNILGTENPFLVDNLDFSNISTRFDIRTLDTGSNVPGLNFQEQLNNGDQINYDAESIYRQSLITFNKLRTIEVVIKIYIDLSLHAGDIIFCDFREISLDNSQTVQSQKSGLYMIEELRHKIVSGEHQYTFLKLVRDSVGRKPF
jgi:hypothetical protein